MVLKQKPIKGSIFLICFVNAVCLLAAVLLSINMHYNDRSGFGSVFIVFGGMSIVLSIVLSNTVQWFHVYEDHIEVRTIWGKQNEVYFCNVQQIIEKDIHINRYVATEHYLFDDGRRENRRLELSTYQNHSNIAVRIYITGELRHFVEGLDIPIIKADN